MVPYLSREERLENIVKANEARRRTADAKRRMKAGELPIGEALENPDLQRVRVLDFIGSMPGIGPFRARQIAERLGISEKRRVKGIGCRQRKALIEEFGGEK